MKTISLFIISTILCSCGLYAQAPSTEDELNSLWNQAKYEEIQILLNAKMTQSPPDVVAVYCAKFFFLFIKPNKAKALEAATKLKQIADGTNNSGFKELADHELAEVQGTPDSEFTPPQAAQLAQLRDIFPSKFPNIRFGVGLGQYLAP